MASKYLMAGLEKADGVDPNGEEESLPQNKKGIAADDSALSLETTSLPELLIESASQDHIIVDFLDIR